MFELDVWFFFVAGPAVLFAGISKGGFGSGAAFASASILALVLEPALALGVMLPLLMLIDVASLPAYWGKWRGPEARYLIIGGVPGVLLGAWFYTISNPNLLRLLIGSISVGFVIWQLWPGQAKAAAGRDRLPNWIGGLAGMAAGFTSFISHAGGPPAAMYLLSQKMTKTEYQATTVLVFWAINGMKFGFYFALGIFTVQTFTANVVLAPFAVLGAWMGVKLHYLVPEKLFFGLTYVLLLATGSKLILDGLA